MSKSQMGKRIAFLRGELSQADFAERLGVSRNTLSRYENGTSIPSADFLQLLVTAFGVDANWLLLGVGEPPKPELDAREAILVDHFRHCDERGKDAMITAGSAMAKQAKDEINVDCDGDQKAG